MMTFSLDWIIERCHLLFYFWNNIQVTKWIEKSLILILKKFFFIKKTFWNIETTAPDN